jgi:hypothetical protein
VNPDPAALAAALDKVAKNEILRYQLCKQSLAAAEINTVARLVEGLSQLYAEVARK